MGRPEQLKEGRTLHFVTGGAYNGKTKWVKQLYGLENDVLWLSGYRQEQPELIDFKARLLYCKVWMHGFNKMQKRWIQIRFEEDGRKSWLIGEYGRMKGMNTAAL